MSERTSLHALPTVEQTMRHALPSPRARQAAPPIGHALGDFSVTPPVRIQPALTVGAPDDPYEREADRVADEVMRMPDPALQRLPRPADTVQRSCATCEEESLQRMPEEEDDLLQADAMPGGPSGSGLVPAAAGGFVTSGAASREVHSARQGGRPLSRSTLDFFEPRLGRNLGSVRLHDGPMATRAAASVGARAFTIGSDIVMGGGQPGVGTEAGKRLLAHELTHVAQQGHAPRRVEED